MTRNELQKILDERGVPKMFYSLDGLKNGMCLCIVQNNGKWQLIYQERSSRNHIGDFDSEDEVCNEFYNILKRNYNWPN